MDGWTCGRMSAAPRRPSTPNFLSSVSLPKDQKKQGQHVHWMLLCSTMWSEECLDTSVSKDWGKTVCSHHHPASDITVTETSRQDGDEREQRDGGRELERIRVAGRGMWGGVTNRTTWWSPTRRCGENWRVTVFTDKNSTFPQCVLDFISRDFIKSVLMWHSGAAQFHISGGSSDGFCCTRPFWSFTGGLSSANRRVQPWLWTPMSEKETFFRSTVASESQTWTSISPEHWHNSTCSLLLKLFFFFIATGFTEIMKTKMEHVKTRANKNNKKWKKDKYRSKINKPILLTLFVPCYLIHKTKCCVVLSHLWRNLVA